jgi:hypothetical protein
MAIKAMLHKVSFPRVELIAKSRGTSTNVHKQPANGSTSDVNRMNGEPGVNLTPKKITMNRERSNTDQHTLNLAFTSRCRVR